MSKKYTVKYFNSNNSLYDFITFNTLTEAVEELKNGEYVYPFYAMLFCDEKALAKVSDYKQEFYDDNVKRLYNK